MNNTSEKIHFNKPTKCLLGFIFHCNSVKLGHPPHTWCTHSSTTETCFTTPITALVNITVLQPALERPEPDASILAASKDEDKSTADGAKQHDGKTRARKWVGGLRVGGHMMQLGWQTTQSAEWTWQIWSTQIKVAQQLDSAEQEIYKRGLEVLG